MALSHSDFLAQLVKEKDRQPLTDLAFLAPVWHPRTTGDCASANNCYRWYYGLGVVLRPKVIAEIGVLWGYSSFSMAVGAGTKPKIFGYDMECYEKGCLDYAREKLATVASEVQITQGNSQKIDKLPWTEKVDIFHVDGDHSNEGCRHDLQMAWPLLNEGGWIIVDDTDLFGGLKTTSEEFAKSVGAPVFFQPTLRGWALIPKV